MCTSIVSNKNKTIIGWNLDILDMECKIIEEEKGVYIAINDKTEGWLPLFGANNRGDFIAMPTCWPYDCRSEKIEEKENNIINLDIDLLLQKRSFEEIKEIVENNKVCSVPNVTFQAQLSNKNGDVLQIIPGQGIKYIEKPDYSVLTNFSPFKLNSEVHPWMGWDRYQKAISMLENASDKFDVSDCFDVLKETAQTVCPTVVSMVYDATENIVYWCENQNWNKISKKQL